MFLTSDEGSFSGKSEHGDSWRRRLIISPRSQHTNCLMQLNAGRWLADKLGKTLVLPWCLSGEATKRCPKEPLQNSVKQVDKCSFCNH